VTAKVADNDELIVDGFRGEVVISPDMDAQARYTEEIRRAHPGDGGFTEP